MPCSIQKSANPNSGLGPLSTGQTNKGFDVVPKVGEGMDYDDPRKGRPEFVTRSGDIVLPKIDTPEPLKVEVNHFLDCIETGAEPLTGEDHARKVVAVLEAGQRSLRSSQGRKGIPELVVAA